MSPLSAPRNPRLEGALPCPKTVAGRIALAATVFATPLVLLVLQLHAEGGGALDTPLTSADAHLRTRFVVVALFAALLTKWCLDWMRGRGR